LTEVLHVAHERDVDIATLDAPATRNALSMQMLDGLRDLVESSARSDSRGLVIDHAGVAFSSGVDIKERRTLAPGGRNHSDALCELYLALWRYPKPLICRVAGSARGGALGFLACADAVVATPAASFAFAEVRLGVAPALVGALAVARFGPGRLAPWLMLGQPFGAPVAHALGLVTHEALGDGRDELDELIAAVALAGPRAVETTKALHRRFIGTDIETLLEEMRALSAEQFAGDEGREGMAAFADRRPPSWARSTPTHHH
jgi:methylglutaconyl-CoA hydratase